jgi:uncharacterized membrane protein YedE/YeeE
MDGETLGLLAALVGLGTGIVLGLAARLGDFCTLGAIEQAIYGEDSRRLRLWGVVLGVAILGTQLGALAGLIDLGQTIYHNIAWNAGASVVGGLVFGYGMAMAGNCGFGALVRFGGGDLRSLVVVVTMGIFGFVALSGPLAGLRLMVFPQTPTTEPQGIAATMQALAGLSPAVTALAFAVPLIAWALTSARLRGTPRMIVWGVLAGLSVPVSLGAMTAISDASLGGVSIEGPSFTAPVGRTILYLMTSTAGGITFAVGSVLGVMVGSFAGSLIRGMFRWEACEDPRELGRQVGGAALMGIGGVVAMGCSVGQGLTGFATLAWSGPVTLASIVLGAAVGLRQLIRGFQTE